MKRWQFWVGILISVLFVYLALRGLNFKDLGEALKDAQYLWLLPGIAVYFIGVLVRAWRWHYLLSPIKNISTLRLFPITCIGYMGNNIYPARIGEILRAVVLKRHYEVPVSASLATIIIERIFDGVVMLGFVFINLPELAKLTGDSGFVGTIQTVAVWGAAAFIGALAVFLLVAMFPERMRSWSAIFIKALLPIRFQDRVIGFVDSFLEGLEFLRSPKDVLMVFLTSIVIWLLETGKYWFVMYAFPFEVSFYALMLMNGIVNLATTIPSAPGYIGTFDAPGIAVLSAFGVERATAAAYTLVLHIALWVPITALGAYYFFREGMDWWQGVRGVEAEI